MRRFRLADDPERGQLLLDFMYRERATYPDGFRNLAEFALYVHQRATTGMFGEHAEFLGSQDKVLIWRYNDVHRSLILERTDGKEWQAETVHEYGRAFFPNRPFRRIVLLTANGRLVRKGVVEVSDVWTALTGMESINDEYAWGSNDKLRIGRNQAAF